MVILFVIEAKYNLISGHVLQEVFLERHALFSAWLFQFSISVFHFSYPFPLFPNARGEGGLQPLWNKLWGGLAPSKISVALVESLEIF